MICDCYCQFLKCNFCEHELGEAEISEHLHMKLFTCTACRDEWGQHAQCSSGCYLFLTALCRTRSVSQAVSVRCGVWVELQIMFQFQFDLGFNKLIGPSCLWAEEPP